MEFHVFHALKERAAKMGVEMALLWRRSSPANASPSLGREFKRVVASYRGDLGVLQTLVYDPGKD